MTDLDRKRAEITAILAETEALPPELRALVREEAAESYEIVRRVLRKLQGLPYAAPPEPEVQS